MYEKMTLRKEAIGVKGALLLSPYLHPPQSSHTITMQVYVYHTIQKKICTFSN
jgi:hypothetical protein